MFSHRIIQGVRARASLIIAQEYAKQESPLLLSTRATLLYIRSRLERFHQAVRVNVISQESHFCNWNRRIALAFLSPTWKRIGACHSLAEIDARYRIRRKRTLMDCVCLSRRVGNRSHRFAAFRRCSTQTRARARASETAMPAGHCSRARSACINRAFNLFNGILTWTSLFGRESRHYHSARMSPSTVRRVNASEFTRIRCLQSYSKAKQKAKQQSVSSSSNIV